MQGTSYLLAQFPPNFLGNMTFAEVRLKTQHSSPWTGM